MAKSHDKKSKGSLAPKAALDSENLNGGKTNGVSKPTSAPKIEDKKAMNKAASKAAEVSHKSDKKSKKSKKQRTPTPVSESESESQSSISSGSESDVDSDDSESSGASEKVVPAKVNGTSKALNGVKPIAASKKAASSSDSDSEASGSDSSSESEAEIPKKAALPAKSKVTTKDLSSSESSDSDSASGKSPAKAGSTPKAAVVNGADAAASSDEDSDENSSEGSTSEGTSESDSESESAAPPPKKRKAEDVASAASDAKKKKTDQSANVDPRAMKNLFVGGISWNVDEEWLSREFAEFGELAGCRIVTDRESGKSKGFGYVEYINLEDAIKALEGMKGTELDGRNLNVDYATPRPDRNANGNDRANQRAKTFGDARSSPSDTLFVGNVSFGATAEMIQDLFAEYGTVTRVSLPTDQESGALKGFGYVGFQSIDEAKAALEGANGSEIEGRSLRLDFATARANNGGGGGGRAGFRGGRGDFRGGRGGRGDFRGGRGGRGDFRGGRGGRGDRGGSRGGGFRGNSTNRGGFNDFAGQKISL